MENITIPPSLKNTRGKYNIAIPKQHHEIILKNFTLFLTNISLLEIFFKREFNDSKSMEAGIILIYIIDISKIVMFSPDDISLYHFEKIGINGVPIIKRAINNFTKIFDNKSELYLFHKSKTSFTDLINTL